MTPHPEKSPATSRTGPPVAWLLGPAFLVVAIWFVIQPRGVDIPDATTPGVTPADVSAAPRFSVLSDPPRVMVNSFERNCMDCHQLFEGDSNRSSGLHQHQKIVLDHGINSRCMNCHHDTDRDKLVLRDGSAVGYEQVATLCGQCHGPKTRQWERGVHGKTLGYWNSDLGESQRLSCTQCHNPHSPRYEHFVPLPGPNTHRMGEVQSTPPHPTIHDPLRPDRGAHRASEAEHAPDHTPASSGEQH